MHTIQAEAANPLATALHHQLQAIAPALAHLSPLNVDTLLARLREDPELTLDVTHALTRQDTTDGFLLRFGFVPHIDREIADACLSASAWCPSEIEDAEWVETFARERIWQALFHITNEALELQGGPVRWAQAA